MFCNQCGTQLQADYNVCPKCGVPLGGRLHPQSRLARHLHTLGILWIVAGGLFLIPSVAMMGLGSVVHMVVPGTEAIGRMVGPFVLWMLGAVLLVLGAGGVCIGWGLMQHQSWARIAAIILGILALFHPPIGTALGIYTLWVLLSDQGGNEYGQIARATG